MIVDFCEFLNKNQTLKKRFLCKMMWLEEILHQVLKIRAMANQSIYSADTMLSHLKRNSRNYFDIKSYLVNPKKHSTL